MDVFEIYVNLWKRVEKEGACVHYYDWPRAEPPSLTADKSGAKGWFIANAHIEDGQPVIQIYRLHCDDEVFTPSRTRGPDGAQLQPPDLHEELVTLAHEYGHLRSFLGRTLRVEWDHYNAVAHRRGEIVQTVVEAMPEGLSPAEENDRIRQALHERLSDDDRARIVHEEALAWQVGREVLRDLQFADFSRYDEREKHGLHAHRYRLGMEHAWPGDELGAPTE